MIRTEMLRKNLVRAWAGCCLAILALGCPGSDALHEPSDESLLPAGTKLQVVVVDDPALATAVEQLRGEWHAQVGFDFEVQQISEEDLDGTGGLAADAMLCPAYLLGRLAEEGWIVPVPKNLIESDQGNWSEIFSLLRVQEAAWGNRAMAVPFGSPLLTCYYRADLLEQLGAQPPTTWPEFQQLAARLAKRENLGDAAPAADMPWSGAIQPLAPGWAGIVLLARAAGYATHRENFSTLFQIDTMQPLIDGPPFVRALEELVATAQFGPADQIALDPAAARTAFWQGRCGLALSWPTASVEDAAGGEDLLAGNSAIPAGVAPLPGSREVYDVGAGRWEECRPDEDARVPLLASGGRLGTVSSNCRWPEAAFRLLLWLSGDQWSPRVSGVSPATTLFRRSHLSSPQDWVEQQISPPAASQYTLDTEQAFNRRKRLFALRIPGRSEYLHALDRAVHRALQGTPPSEALRDTSSEWNEITQRMGVKKQRHAYWSSLGID